MVLVDGIHPKIIQELPKIHPQIQKNINKIFKNISKIIRKSSQNHQKIIARSPPRGITTPLNYLLTYLLMFTFILLFIYLFSCTGAQLLVFWIKEHPQKGNISLPVSETGQRAIHAPLRSTTLHIWRSICELHLRAPHASTLGEMWDLKMIF